MLVKLGVTHGSITSRLRFVPEHHSTATLVKNCESKRDFSHHDMGNMTGPHISTRYSVYLFAKQHTENAVLVPGNWIQDKDLRGYGTVLKQSCHLPLRCHSGLKKKPNSLGLNSHQDKLRRSKCLPLVNGCLAPAVRSMVAGLPRLQVGRQPWATLLSWINHRKVQQNNKAGTKQRVDLCSWKQSKDTPFPEAAVTRLALLFL